MKNFIILLILSILLFSACLSNPYKVEKPELTEEDRAEYQALIDENLPKVDNPALTEEERLDALVNVCVSNERLGNYDKAIQYYQELLKLDASNYLALNNLVAIYEEVGELENAKTYVDRLYPIYKDRAEVVEDTIVIYVKLNEFDTALNILEDYTREHQSPETAEFISRNYEYIARMREKFEGTGE